MLEDAAEPGTLAAALADWSRARPLWQRRAACVAFVPHAEHGDGRIPDLPELVLAACERVVRDPERFAQTGVGWVLRELSLFDRPRVIAFADEHLDDLSREAARSIAEKMPARDRAALLARHARARRPTR